MPQASGTRVLLGYVEESTRGTTPGSPTLDTLRVTSRNVNLTKNILESNEVRSTRQKADVRHGFNQVQGQIGCELSLIAFDDIIRFAMGDAWVTPTVTGSPSIGATADGGASGLSLLTRSTGSFITDGFREGEYVTAANFADSDTNANWRIVTVNAASLVVYDPDDLIVDESPNATPTITYVGQRMDIGTNLLTMSLERQFQDISQFELYRGVAVNQMSLSVQPERIVEATFDLLGMSAAAVSGSSVSGSAPTAAATHSPFSAFDGSMFEGGSLISLVTGLDLQLANNRSLNPVIGSLYSPDVFEGQAVITGTAVAFFQDETLLNKFINEIESTMWIELLDPNGTDFWNIIIPRVKYTGGSMDPPQEGPVPLSMPFQALEATVNAPSGASAYTSLTIQVSNS